MALLQRMTCNLRHSMSLRRPVLMYVTLLYVWILLYTHTLLNKYEYLAHLITREQRTIWKRCSQKKDRSFKQEEYLMHIFLVPITQLIIGLFCGKRPLKIRHPMRLRHLVPYWITIRCGHPMRHLWHKWIYTVWNHDKWIFYDK